MPMHLACFLTLTVHQAVSVCFNDVTCIRPRRVSYARNIFSSGLRFLLPTLICCFVESIWRLVLKYPLWFCPALQAILWLKRTDPDRPPLFTRNLHFEGSFSSWWAISMRPVTLLTNMMKSVWYIPDFVSDFVPTLGPGVILDHSQTLSELSSWMLSSGRQVEENRAAAWPVIANRTKENMKIEKKIQYISMHYRKGKTEKEISTDF